jgi:hypothetical protein
MEFQDKLNFLTRITKLIKIKIKTKCKIQSLPCIQNLKGYDIFRHQQITLNLINQRIMMFRSSQESKIKFRMK